MWRGLLEARLQERLEQEQLKRRNLALVSKWSLRQQRLWASAVEADWSNKAKMEAAWVLMEWEPFENVSDFPFLSVQNYFDQNNIRVPKVYHFDNSRGLFLLEDLGDREDA